MTMIPRLALSLALLLVAAPFDAQAQPLRAGTEAAPYQAERHLIESTLQTVVAVIQEITLKQEDSGLSDRFARITDNLTRAAKMMDPTPNTHASVSAGDLDDLNEMLQDITREMEALRDALRDDGEYDLADRLAPIHRDLRRAAREADRLAHAPAAKERPVTVADGEPWLRPGRYENREDRRERRAEEIEERVEEKAERLEEKAERVEERWERKDDRWDRKRDRDDDWWRGRRGWRGHTSAFVGEYHHRWPFRNETALYRPIPAIRYNRVEGLNLGIGRSPLAWDDYRRADVYGQVGYAFALDEWRYQIGVESNLTSYRRADYSLKLGAEYHHNTGTRDLWKTSWVENSLAAFFFENDFFDYYDEEGWSIYAVQRISRLVQLSAGYRQDDYKSLARQTGWSVFDGGDFSFNPPIDEGRMQSLVFAVEGGRVRGLHDLPRGVAFRLEAEVGQGLGGDFDFTRYVGDVRAYLPVTPFSSLALRLRGGTTTGDFIPLQKAFTIGGIGSVRAYPQNTFLGTRMLLGNAEYIIDDADLLFDWLDDFQLIGLLDAGWVNTFGTDAFDFDDVLPAAGVGLGFDRTVRLEIVWPLRDFGSDRDPSLWLRITPSF